MTQTEAAERAQKAAKTAHGFALAALIGSVVIVAIVYSALTWIAFTGAWKDEAERQLVMSKLVVLWASALPIGLMLVALGHVRKALKEFSSGRFFGPAPPKAVRSAAQWAIASVLVKITIVPSLESLTADSVSPQISLNGTDLPLLAFLIFLWAIGRVLELAAALKSENEAFV